MGGELYLCTWGDIRLWANRIEWEQGNTLVKHDLAASDDHPVQPRGGRLQVATLELIFDDFIGEAETGLDAFRRFQATRKERRLFTHPVDGAFFARIDSLKPRLDPDSIGCTCEFVPDEIVSPVQPSGAGSGTLSGEESVLQASEKATSELVAVGMGIPSDKASKMDFKGKVARNVAKAYGVKIDARLDLDVDLSVTGDVSLSASASAAASASGTVSATASASASASAFAFASVYAVALAEARASAVAEASGIASASAFAFAYASAAVMADAAITTSAWSQAEDLSPRQVQVDVARLSNSISDMIDTGGLMEDIDLFPSFQAIILFGEAVRSSALAATASTPRVFLMRVRAPTALLPLAAKIYGGAVAQERASQIAAFNDIRTVGWLDPGDYLMPEAPRSSAPAIRSAR